MRSHVLLGATVLLGVMSSLWRWRWASSHHRAVNWTTTTELAVFASISSTVGEILTLNVTDGQNTSASTEFSASRGSDCQQNAKTFGNKTHNSKLQEQTNLTSAGLLTSGSETTLFQPSSGNFTENTTVQATAFTANTSQDVSYHNASSTGADLQTEDSVTTPGPTMSALANGTSEDDIDYVKMGEEILVEAANILDSGIWDFEKRTEEGDAIFSRQLDSGKLVYRLTGIVEMPAQDLLVIIYDGLADYPKWNPTLLECRVLEKINEQTDISYTVSAPGARGYVSSRDFISLRHWDLYHNAYVAASKSIDFPGAPINLEYIRGVNGPGCMELRPLNSDQSRTEFRWLFNTKINGWIPSLLADKAYKKFMTKYMDFLREYCKKIKQRASDFTFASTTPQNITT